MFNPCNTLNGDFGIITYQSRVSMCLLSFAGTKHAAINNWRITASCLVFSSYSHLCVVLYTTYFTAAIDVAVH